jgi:hypothetical protein
MVKIIDINLSNRKSKKYVATLDDGNRIHFGLKFSETYLDHKDKEKRSNYLKRHIGNEMEKYLITNRIVSPATLSALVLWGPTTDLNKNVEILNKKLNYG